MNKLRTKIQPLNHTNHRHVHTANQKIHSHQKESNRKKV